MNEILEREGMSDGVKEDIIRIMNEGMEELCKEMSREVIGRVMSGVGAIKDNGIKEKVKKEKIEEGVRRYKSQKAKDYALEHGISLEEFESTNVSKKEVEDLVRRKARENKEGKKEEGKSGVVKEKVEKDDKQEYKKEVKKDKVICSGINKKGECCKCTGTIKPEGAKRKYCFRHSEDWRSFECESDSSDSESESGKELKNDSKNKTESAKELKNDSKNKKESESESELEEELFE